MPVSSPARRTTATNRLAPPARLAFAVALLTGMIAPALGEPTFSDWNQATGLKRIEYRWRQNDASGCEVEYRNTDDRDHKKYKSRIVFQINGDERTKPYSIVSFADPGPYLDSVPTCSQVTDVSVTRF